VTDLRDETTLRRVSVGAVLVLAGGLVVLGLSERPTGDEWPEPQAAEPDREVVFVGDPLPPGVDLPDTGGSATLIGLAALAGAAALRRR
jgi:MYXO-CTERM domain-containing protein